MKKLIFLSALAISTSAFSQMSEGGQDLHTLNCKIVNGSRGISVQFVYVTQTLAPELSVRRAFLVSRPLLDPSSRARPTMSSLTMTEQTADMAHFKLSRNSEVTAVLRKSPAKALVYQQDQLAYVCTPRADF